MTGYGKILLMLAAGDILITILGIHLNIFEEVNVLLRWHLERGGYLLFASVKILLNAASILLLETVWERHPQKQPTIRKIYWIAIISYAVIVLYSTILLLTNLHLI